MNVQTIQKFRNEYYTKEVLKNENTPIIKKGFLG